MLEKDANQNSDKMHSKKWDCKNHSCVRGLNIGIHTKYQLANIPMERHEHDQRNSRV